MKRIQLSSGKNASVRFWGRERTFNTIPMVLVHGFCEDSSIWTELTGFMPDIPGISLDLPGFGDSDLPEHADMAIYADVLAATLDAQGVKKCVLIGHSLGGYAALEFAARYPEPLAGFGLFHSHPFEDNAERKTARQRGIDTLEAGKKDLYVAQLFPNLFAPEFVKSNDPVIKTVTEQGKKQPTAGIISALRAMMGRRDHQETLKNAGVPVLFLLGGQDSLVPLQDAIRVALTPDMAQVSLAPEVGHMGMLEAPHFCAEALIAFYQWTAGAGK